MIIKADKTEIEFRGLKMFGLIITTEKKLRNSKVITYITLNSGGKQDGKRSKI